MNGRHHVPGFVSPLFHLVAEHQVVIHGPAHKLTYNDTTGYINGDYLTVEPMLASGDTVEAIQEKEEAKKQAGHISKDRGQ